VGASDASPGGLAGAGSVFVLSGVDGSQLHRADGTAAGDGLGASVDHLDDLGGDGATSCSSARRARPRPSSSPAARARSC